jgi:hypothetical protein
VRHRRIVLVDNGYTELDLLAEAEATVAVG